jgi:hypothetical protein
MDHFESVHGQDIKRYRNLLETSIDETERRTIQKLLVEEEAKQALATLEQRQWSSFVVQRL